METSLAHILEGLRLGKGSPASTNGDDDSTTQVVRLSDVDYENKRIEWTDVSGVSGSNPEPHHVLQTGDILITSRGVHRTAFLVEEPPACTVADRTFYVARPDPSVVEPAYLAWYLNELRAQTYLEAHSRGTSMQTITKKALERLPVVLPDLDTQRRIADIQRLVRRERELVQQWTAKRAELARGVMLNLIESA